MKQRIKNLCIKAFNKVMDDFIDSRLDLCINWSERFENYLDSIKYESTLEKFFEYNADNDVLYQKGLIIFRNKEVVEIGKRGYISRNLEHDAANYPYKLTWVNDEKFDYRAVSSSHLIPYENHIVIRKDGLRKNGEENDFDIIGVTDIKDEEFEELTHE